MSKKIKYAMVAINSKEKDNHPVIRRVLISYKGSKTSYAITTYTGTRYITCDPYFNDKKSSHQYKFEDDGYSLTAIKGKQAERYDEASLNALKAKRSYHSYISDAIWSPESNITDFRFMHAVMPVTFKATSDEEAIKIFTERNELR